MKKSKKGDFWEVTFGKGSEHRDPFSKKPVRSIKDAFKEISKDITDEELKLFVNEPEKLSKAAIEYIQSNIQNNPDTFKRYQEIIKSKNQSE